MKVLIAAGGTGGHIYPGIAIAEEIISMDKNAQILFVGGHDGLESDLVKKEGYEIKLICARGFLRKISYKAISAPFINLIGFFQSIFLLLSYKPDVVILMGGYSSFSSAAAAKLLGIRTILHEQNVLPGIVSRLLSKFVDQVVLSFEGSRKYLKGPVYGNPVRKRIINKGKKQAFGRNVLIVGGSQGARSINHAVISSLPKFAGKNIELLHIIGERDYANLLQEKSFGSYPFYHPVPYMYNIEEGLASADLIVSRAGATAIAEFLVLGIPMVLVPFPYSAEGHQDLNAKVIADAGAAAVLPDAKLSLLPEVVFELVDSPKKLEEMRACAKRIARPDAAKRIVDLIYAKH